jgi:nitronate monooxygenase
VPVFSFTFGIPAAHWLAAFRSAGIKTVGTVTTAREAVLLEEAGVDAVVAQGEEAGGHRGTFAGPFELSMVPTFDLLRHCVEAVRVPVIASGGIMDGTGIRAALDAGAAAVQMGTAFIPCPESGAPAAFKRAILDARADETAVTRAFSGRPARGIRNHLMTAIERADDSILPYPWQNAATRQLRSAAGRAGISDYLSLWAGRNVARARELPAGQLVAALAREAGLLEA